MVHCKAGADHGTCSRPAQQARPAVGWARPGRACVSGGSLAKAWARLSVRTNKVLIKDFLGHWTGQALNGPNIGLKLGPHSFSFRFIIV